MFLLLRSLNFIFNPLQLFHCERIPGEVASRVCSVSLLFVIYFTSGLQIKHYFKTFLILLMWPLASLILKWLLPRLGFRRKLKFPLFTQWSPQAVLPCLASWCLVSCDNTSRICQFLFISLSSLQHPSISV